MLRCPLVALVVSLLIPAAQAEAQTQPGRLSGAVTATEGGAPLPGVHVSVLGTKVTTETNAQGKYSLSVAPGTYRLRASAIGYVPMIIENVPVTAGKDTPADFALQRQLVSLAQVVVTGYGTQERRDVTGAVTTVTAAQIQENPSTNALEAIKGKIAGVDIISTGYKPGDGVQVRVRGQRSLKASNDPLYVLDGVPIAGGIGDLNPTDILSIEVLKDASATAIYGSRGANGVVLVTSRRGLAGRTRISYDTYLSSQNPTKKVAVFNGAEFATYKREAFRNSAGGYKCPPEVLQCDVGDASIFFPVEIASIKAGRSTDWQDLILRSSAQASHQLSVSGGNDRTQFSVSGNLVRQTGIVKGQDFDRKSMRVSLESQATPRLRVGGSALLLRSVQNIGRGDGLYGEALSDGPLGPPFDSTGAIIFLPIPDGQRVNPLADVANHIDEHQRTRAFASLFASLNLAEGLDLRVNYGPDFTFERFGLFRGAQTQANFGSGADAQLGENRTFDYTLDNILTFKRGFGADHRIDATLLYSIEKQTFDNNFARSSGLPYESQRFFNLGSGAVIESISSFISQWALQSYMARVNYTLKDRYLLTLTSRLDGSSRLAPGKKYALFPSVALGWRVIDESFGATRGPISSLKLRASYGRTGNTSVDPYQTQGGLARTVYSFGTGTGYGFRPNTLPNPNLEWEKTDQFDAGVDFTLFRGRLSGTVDAYRAFTHDLLLDRQLPPTTGYTSILQNIGETKNTGLELALSGIVLDGWHGIHWSNDVTVSVNRNEIVSLYGAKVDDVGNRWFIGQPINGGGNSVYFDQRFLGVWQLADSLEAKKYGQKPGQIRVQDVNGDGKINDQDRVILGNTYPKWTGSFTSRLEWKRVDFSAQAVTRQGFMVFDDFRTGQSTLAGRYNNLKVNYWTPTNPSNSDPRPSSDQEFPVYGGTRGYEDGSFVKIRNITIGVTVPPELAKRAGAQSLRIYGTAQNPFTFTNFRGLDPEGRTSAGTPPTRGLLVGASLGF